MNRNRSKGLALLTAICLMLSLLPPPHAVQAQNRTVGTHARAAALIDVESGRMLYSYRGDEQMLIASLTKIMTAIVAIEHGQLEDDVKVGPNAFAKEGSSIYLQLGEEMTLENMLYGLMLRSGNDAATAIAEHVGGSEEGFVHMMNAKAEMLGLKNTHFANPHGLDAPGHYSTANDLAVLTAYAMHNPVFKTIVATPEKKADNPNEKWDYKWFNKNKMLRLYEGADGVKTGYTKKALRCLVSSATRDGQQLVAVTLNDGNDWNDHAALLDYGFNHYPLVPLIARGEKVNGYELAAGISFSYPLGTGEQQHLTKKLVLNARSAPSGTSSESSSASSSETAAGTDEFGLGGRIVLQLGGRTIGQVPVYAPDRLPPEREQWTAAYPQKPGNWLQAMADAVRALFTLGKER